VIEIVEEDGEISFRTRGDNNNTEDKERVPAENLVGVYKMRIAGAGHIAMFMQSTAGLIICVVLPIILLVGYDIIRRRIYEKNNKQDTDALLAELEALRAEKAEKEKAAIGADNSDSTEN
jgi:signal peptidase